VNLLIALSNRKARRELSKLGGNRTKSFKKSSRFIPALLALSSFSAQAITLTWDPSTSSNIAGYIVYSGTNTSSYNTSNFVGNVTTNVPSGLLEGLTYFFAVTAKDTLGLESDFSNEISVTIPVSLGQPVMATNQLVSGKVKLTWGSTASSTFRVYYKTNLTDGAWLPLTSNLTAVGPITSWTDPSPPQGASRFYRVFKTQ
jgi:hypothetical protein